MTYNKEIKRINALIVVVIEWSLDLIFTKPSSSQSSFLKKFRKCYFLYKKKLTKKFIVLS